MNGNDFAEKMANGSFFVDNSKHRYGKKTGYQWTAKSQTGAIREGVEKDKEKARKIAEAHALQMR